MAHVLTIIGTRPEIIKMAPLIPLLDDAFEHTFLFTGQHYSQNMVEIFLDEMGLRRPDAFLDVNDSDRDRLEEGIRAWLVGRHFDAVLVYGDTNSTLAAARAVPKEAKLVHIEAGIRSFDSRMPEEFNRIEVDRLSHYRLPPSGLGRYFLTDFEGIDPDTVEVVGNLVVDAYRQNRERILSAPLDDGLSPRGYHLLTMHRAENVDDPKRLKAILDNLARLDKPVVFPVHPRTEARMREFGLEFPVNLRILEPLGYYRFMRLMHDCELVITDSGGVQEEAVTLGVPCITLRDNTERMETVFLQAAVLYDADHRNDLDVVAADMCARRDVIRSLKNPYGEGDAAQRILRFLQDKLAG